MPGLSQTFKGSFMGAQSESRFDDQIRTVNFMTFLRFANARRDDGDAYEVYECLKPDCRNPSTKTEERKAKVVETLIGVFQSDPDAKVPNICNCENLVEQVCCNANFAAVADDYNAQTEGDSFFL